MWMFKARGTPAEPPLPTAWQSIVDGRPATEQALMRAVLTAHSLVGPDSPPPPPHEVELADQLYALAQLRPHAIVHSFEGLAAGELLASVQPEYSYLVSTMGSSRPHLQYVAELFVRAAESASDRNHAFLPWRPVAQLVKAAHFTQGGRLVEALAAVDQAVAQLRKLRGHGSEVRAGVRTAAEAARQALTLAIDRQPIPEERRAEFDDASYDLDLEGRRLLARDEFDRAREHFDRSLALAAKWHAALPGDARAIRAVATTLGNRLMCLTEAEEFVAAVPDGRQAVQMFQSLRAEPFIAPFEATAAEAEVRLALALAGAVESGRPERAGPDPSGAVTRHGTAAIEACRRMAGPGRGAEPALGRVLALYAKALRLLDDAEGVDLVTEEAVLAAETEALATCRALGERLTPHDRRHFAQVALAHAISRLDEDAPAALDAALDFVEQMHQLTLVGLPVHPDADHAQRIEELAYAEYIIGRSKIQLGDSSFGQHLVNAQYILDQHPGDMADPIARLKREIDEFIARRRQEEADRGGGQP